MIYICPISRLDPEDTLEGSKQAMKTILIGKDNNGSEEQLILAMANRHGLITGATGTGKTVTLQRITEQFSLAGIPVFTADVKGDIAGLAYPGIENSKIKDQLKKLKISTYTSESCPVIFWDIYGKKGLPLRTTISEIGPILFGRILNLNDVQQGILNAAFSYADDQGLLLLDLKDIRALLDWMIDKSDELKSKYGNISQTSIGAIQRNILTLNESGGDKFFGEPALKLEHLMQKDPSGKGVISVLDATQLIHDSRLYSTFLLWLLSELFEKLPEVGDQDLPKLAFFFDEAHLLFNSAPKFLLEKIEQMIRLIRSKGVGVYFVTQNPSDVPEVVLNQLGNRIQHALRAFTPKDQKSVKAAAQTFRQNPKLDTEKVITELSVGEALISFLDQNGSPTMVAKATIIPPNSRIGTISDPERNNIIHASSLFGVYENAIDRESASEILTNRINAEKMQNLKTKTDEYEKREREERTNRSDKSDRPEKDQDYSNQTQNTMETLAKSAAKILNSRVGQQIIRGVLGTIFRKK